jgi:hypothetical protein
MLYRFGSTGYAPRPEGARAHMLKLARFSALRFFFWNFLEFRSCNGSRGPSETDQGSV